MKVFDYLHDRLLRRAGLTEPPPKPDPRLSYESLRRTEWSEIFERLMRNRLIMGALRYGRLRAGAGKPGYLRVDSIIRRLRKYEADGNKEHLVDAANLCLCEFVECTHPKAHFGAVDDGEHTEVAGKQPRMP